MSNDTKTDNNTNRSNDDTNRVKKFETTLTRLAALITDLAQAVGVAKRDTAVDTLDSIREAVVRATTDLASSYGTELKDDSTLVGVVGEAKDRLAGGKEVAMSLRDVQQPGDRWMLTKEGAIDLLRARHSALDGVPKRLAGKGSDDPVATALDELLAIEDLVLRHGLAGEADARGALERGTPLPVVLGDLMRRSAVVDAVNRGSVNDLKAEIEKWKDVARQSQRDRDEWQARQANAESECTKRMLERDVLGNKLVDALGVPHRTINVAEDLRHNKPLPPGYKDEADHPLIVRLAEVLTGRPMGTELPESIVARATAEVLSWMDAPKVPVVRLPPMLGRSRDKDESSEVDRWKKAAESESARADRMEAQALQSAKSASDWKSTAQASQARVETMSDQLKSAEGMLRNIRAGMIAALRVHPDADHGDAALISYAKKAADDSAVDGRVYNDGRAEGRADIAAKLRAILDPEDKHHLSLEGLLNAVSWKAAPMRVAAVNLLARLLHESGRQPVQRGENLAQQSTFVEWADLHARVKQGRAMTASAMLDSMIIAAAPAPAGSTRLSGECLARELHRCEKAAIESGFTARQHSTTWIPFDELPEAAKKGRMAQAEFLEKTCDLAFFVWDK